MSSFQIGTSFKKMEHVYVVCLLQKRDFGLDGCLQGR